MSIFSNLPREIQPLVFQDLSKTDHYECMKTCKAWYSEASAFYHSEIKLTFYRHKQFLKVSEITRLDGSKIGDYVRKIEFYCLDNDLLDEQQFHRLMYNLPYLTNIRIDDKYIGYFNSIPESYLTHTRELFMQSYLTNSELINSYFSANVRLKEQITTLRLVTLNIFSGRGSSKKLLTALSEFPRLNYLLIGKNGEFNTTGVHLTSILNYCRNLETLDLTRDTQWNISTKNNHIHTNLASLIFKIDYVSEQNLEYMMDYIPNLKLLDMVVTYETFENLLSKLKPHQADRFIQYLKKIDTVHMQRHWLTPRKRVAAGLWTENEVFWRRMRELCDNDRYCELSVDLVPPTVQNDGIYFKKQNQDITIICKMLWDYANYETWVNQIDFLVFEQISMYDVPSMVNDANGDMYPRLICPLLNMLKRQRIKRMCQFFVQQESQELSFCYGVAPNDGIMKNLVLHNEMLQSLGQLYPFIEDLVLEKCVFEKKDVNTYYMDLTEFKNIHQLTFDFDAILGNEKLKYGLYIDFNDTEHYVFTPGDPNVLHRMNPAPCKTDYQLEIRHVRVQKFVFKHRGLLVPVVKG